MCGIWLDIGRAGDTQATRCGATAMALMAHRGPDAQSTVQILVANRPIELGHARLSIIDLDERANQPMRRGGLVIVFNGEIYNYVELREELTRLGEQFSTSSDTEVLLAAYARWNVDMLPRLRGMFAFALVDTAKRCVLLARDPFGIKPLFLARTTLGLAVASEIPPLLDTPGVSRRANPSVIREFLVDGITDAGASTFFADIESLPPAHYALVSLDRSSLSVEPKRYWRPVYSATLHDPTEAARRVRDCFLDSIRLHLRSDVPIGTMLSGGIDSSAIVAGARQLLGPDAPLHTFSFVSPGDPFDESRFIRLMSETSGTIGHLVEASADSFQSDIDRLIRCQGEPFGSTSIYAQYRVASAAKAAGIKVLLDGQGADELFAGYRFYLGARIAGLLAAGEPIRAGRLLARVASMPGIKLPSAVYHTLTALNLPGASPLLRAAVERGSPAAFIDPGWLRSNVQPANRQRLPRRLALLDRLHQSLEQEVLPGLLRYEDRNTMAFSIEARVPFLDLPLVETACSLSPELLVDDTGTTKAALRSALRDLVPNRILDRRDKIGFATPEARWLSAAARWVDHELSAPTPSPIPFIRLDELKAHLQHRRQQSRPWPSWAWRAISLAAWSRRFEVEYPSPGSPPASLQSDRSYSQNASR